LGQHNIDRNHIFRAVHSYLENYMDYDIIVNLIAGIVIQNLLLVNSCYNLALNKCYNFDSLDFGDYNSDYS